MSPTLTDQEHLVFALSACPQQSLALAIAKPDSSVGSVADLGTGGCWFDPWLGQYSFQGLMMVIATGFIPISPLSVISTMVMWENSPWLGKNIVQSAG